MGLQSILEIIGKNRERLAKDPGTMAPMSYLTSKQTKEQALDQMDPELAEDEEEVEEDDGKGGKRKRKRKKAKLPSKSELEIKYDDKDKPKGK